MAWFFRVIEVPGTGWSCRRGRGRLDDHPDLETALAHITAVARATSPAEVFLHYVDGRVLRLGEPGAGPLDAEPEPA